MHGETGPVTASVHPELDDATVVVVDDEPANVVLLERILRGAGVGTVHGLTDPRMVVQTCMEQGADLLMTDMLMPEMDGFAVLQAVQQAVPSDFFLPVVVLTADSSTVTRDRALMAGAKDFVTKPFDRAEVVLRVRNLLETSRLYAALRKRSVSLEEKLAAREEAAVRQAERSRERRERVDGVFAEGALRMVFQPICELETEEVSAFEALARFNADPSWPPDRWFDEATAVGRGTELELLAVASALRQMAALPSGVFMSVNVSPATAMDRRLADLLLPVAASVCLELTEHTRVTDHERLLAAVRSLRKAGLRFAVDDAGAGYAGLRQMLLLRPDIIKLDLELIRGIDTDPARRALSTAMVSFARDIGAEIVAEGIETAAELDVLRSVGIRWGQGYHLGRPGEITDLVDLA